MSAAEEMQKGRHPLCCRTCAPVIALMTRHDEGSIPHELRGRLIDDVLATLGWKNPFQPGTADLKEKPS